MLDAGAGLLLVVLLVRCLLFPLTTPLVSPLAFSVEEQDYLASYIVASER